LHRSRLFLPDILNYAFVLLFAHPLDLECYSQNVRHSRLIPLSEHALWTNYSCQAGQDDQGVLHLSSYLLLLVRCTWSLLHNDGQGVRVAMQVLELVAAWDLFSGTLGIALSLQLEER
jgi:hypothetical protein